MAGLDTERVAPTDHQDDQPRVANDAAMPLQYKGGEPSTPSNPDAGYPAAAQVDPIQPDPGFDETAYEAGRDDNAIMPEKPPSSVAGYRLAAHLSRGYQEAKRHRAQIGVDDRLMACLRTYRGEYDAATAALIAAKGGTDVFRRLTTQKCDDLGSWLKDVLGPTEDQPWEAKATPIPELSEQAMGEILVKVQQEAAAEMQAAIQNGYVLTPEQMYQLGESLAKQAKVDADKNAEIEAKERAQAMSKVLVDQQTEGDFQEALHEFINNYKMYPAAFLKGPYVRMKKKLRWEGGQPVIAMVAQLTWSAPNPNDMFPSPNATKAQDGDLYEREMFSRKDLFDLQGVDGYSEREIIAVLDEHPHGETSRLAYVESDTEKAELTGVPYPFEQKTDSKLEGVHCSCNVSGAMLQDWGLEVENRDAEYSIYALLVGRHVIKAMVNPDPLDQRPYSMTSYKPINGSYWGMALPELMDDIQKEGNACVRAMVNNIAMSSGPIMDVDVNALPDDVTSVTKIAPWSVYQYDGSKLQGGTRKPYNFTTIDCNVDVYINAYSAIKKEADDITGIPAFITGSDESKGAGETARGLAMLMDAAAKGVRENISDIGQKVICDSIQRQYVWNMLYNPEKSIKGDCTISTRGPLAVIAKHQSQIAAGNFLSETNNPTDLEIMGVDRRANVLRNRARLLDMPSEDVVPPQEEIEHKLEQQQQMQQQMQEQQMQEQQAIAEEQQAIAEGQA